MSHAIMCHTIGHSCLVCLWHVDHDQISSERAAHSLVMEFVPPIKITNMAEVTQANIINITDTDKLDLADSLARRA